MFTTYIQFNFKSKKLQVFFTIFKSLQSSLRKVLKIARLSQTKQLTDNYDVTDKIVYIGLGKTHTFAFNSLNPNTSIIYLQLISYTCCFYALFYSNVYTCRTYATLNILSKQLRNSHVSAINQLLWVLRLLCLGTEIVSRWYNCENIYIFIYTFTRF